jgi:CubicO group peptidase (beta-lactamase class C family)
MTDDTGDALERAAAAGSAVLRRAVAAGDIPGAAFAVGHADRGSVLVEAIGHADPASGRAVTPDTAFCLASTTKPISTSVLAALAERGAIDLDDPITAHVPEFLPNLWPAPAPTVRQVAAHTAGLGAHHRFFYDDERPAISVVDAVRTLARPTFPVGFQWRYSNLGYGVLQLAMERASGMSMAELAARHVFEPLEMNHSAWGGPLGPDGAAVRHLTPTEPYPGYVTDHPPASEAWCSITDLLEFGLAHARSSLLSSASHAALIEPAAPRQPDGAAYALGWVTREFRDIRLLVHGGRMGGVGAHLTVVPALGLVVAGLANIETDRLAEAVATVLHAMVPSYSPPVAVDPWTTGAADPRLVGRWEGMIQLGDDSLPASIDTLGERITMQVGGDSTELVMPHVGLDGVMGHANLSIPHPLIPSSSICHLDAGAMTIVDGVPTPDIERDRPDVIVGTLVSAQYPNAVRRRQGDAVSAALYLERTG